MAISIYINNDNETVRITMESLSAMAAQQYEIYAETKKQGKDSSCISEWIMQ